MIFFFLVRVGKYKLGANTNLAQGRQIQIWAPGAGKRKLGTRAGVGGQDQGRGPSKEPGVGKYKYPLSNFFNKLTFNNLTDLTHLITFFILILLHTVSKIGVYGLLYILTYSL